ncbi:MAG: glycoside hydrolase family 2 [Candidatus Nealsonbacteria bacterium]|nr:glycoside hydrolase family 2 [Candidatus Nealsonbacteria bacterium]
MPRHCPGLMLLFVTLGWLAGPACSAADRPEDHAPTTPTWTPPDAFLAAEGTGGETGWPTVRPECRPGAYWWWPGSAVTKEDLTWNLETYRRSGWGNMGVVVIYGVRGEEDRFIDLFSPKWFEMFNHAVAEARRLGMNIDLTPSSGWRMGGPHVPPQHGGQSFAVENGQIVARPNGAKVKRAGPGGAGLAINPYSEAAVAFHLDFIGKRFDEGTGSPPRAFYYDSFENPGNWCPELLDSFRRLRGYPLQEHADALAGRGDADRVRRVVCDYRETLSDVLIERVEQIVGWGKQRGSGLRMQAHGAPANLLDMYAAAAIPETEVFGASQFDVPGFRRDPKWIRPDRQSDLVNRFASSAAHVAGRKVVISESFTWLRNHYHTALSHVKAESDNLLVNGINCIYYHGICFAPKKTAWPGWLFYASTEANARNSIFRDVPALNAYLTRCQSVLQEGRPQNDVLLYWPVYDLWMGDGTRERRFTVHHPAWIEETPCGQAGRWMIDNGYTFDFVSDRQLLNVRYEDNALRTAGASHYRTIVVPAVKVMTVGTARRLLELAKAGATVLVWKGLPQDVPGWNSHADRKQRLGGLLGRLSFEPNGVAAVGKGKVLVGEDLAALLETAGVAREPLVDRGLKFIRRKSPTHVSYFIVNHSAKPVNAWVPVASRGRSAVLMDPMTARTGVAPTRVAGDAAVVDKPLEVYLQMQPGETRVLRVFSDKAVGGPAWPIAEPAGEPIEVKGTWQVQFTEGGPVLPRRVSMDDLRCWTESGDDNADRFAGAARYTITVDLPASDADGWVLDLGDVRESARVWIGGKAAGLVVAHPFRVDVTGLLKPGNNEIAVEVTNLSANRIRDLDRRGVDWKKFHDINFVDQMYRPFDASTWDPKPSGLLGPVTIQPYRIRE